MPARSWASAGALPSSLPAGMLPCAVPTPCQACVLPTGEQCPLGLLGESREPEQDGLGRPAHALPLLRQWAQSTEHSGQSSVLPLAEAGLTAESCLSSEPRPQPPTEAGHPVRVGTVGGCRLGTSWASARTLTAVLPPQVPLCGPDLGWG